MESESGGDSEEEDSKMNFAGLTEEINTVEKHQDNSGDSDVAQHTDDARLVRRQQKRPRRQKREQQDAHGDKDDMEAFE
jgi:hypothetical protein